MITKGILFTLSIIDIIMNTYEFFMGIFGKTNNLTIKNEKLIVPSETTYSL